MKWLLPAPVTPITNIMSPIGSMLRINADLSSISTQRFGRTLYGSSTCGCSAFLVLLPKPWIKRPHDARSLQPKPHMQPLCSSAAASLHHTLSLLPSSRIGHMQASLPSCGRLASHSGTSNPAGLTVPMTRAWSSRSIMCQSTSLGQAQWLRPP